MTDKDKNQIDESLEAVGGESNPENDPGAQEPATPEDRDEEKHWPDDADSRRRRLEAVLFMSREPKSSRKLSQLAFLEDGTQARTMIKELNQHYDRVGRAFYVKRVAGGFQLRTRPQFADWIRKLEHIPRPKRLSTPALETLTVVAYRQPIIKAEIEAIRGVSCGEMLRQLLEKGLVKIAGRSEKLGRPFLYGTTREFLAYYGLNTINDLPRSKQLSGEGLPDWASSDENHSRPKPMETEPGKDESKNTRRNEEE